MHKRSFIINNKNCEQVREQLHANGMQTSRELRNCELRVSSRYLIVPCMYVCDYVTCAQIHAYVFAFLHLAKVLQFLLY